MSPWLTGIYAGCRPRTPFQLAPLDAKHDRTAFRSDSEPLNRYLQEQASQDSRRRVAACALLADALDRAARSEIAAFALVVDAKDEAAGAFYLHHGFMALPDSPLTLFLPLASIRRF